ncbi:MAG: SDR family oxidoreductase [Clostridiales bacterium]|nr:SDR family oxidoreductase [Clostridiales bacterium]
MSLEGKVAVVTGSATGIGQGVAVALAGNGARVVVTSHLAPADETMSLIKAVGGEAVLVQGDLSVREGARNLFDKAYKAFGAVDILVNNAALQINHWLLECTEAEYDLLFKVNVIGYWMCTQEALPLLKESKHGRIINTASIHAKRPTNFDVAYSMTKGAIKMLTRESAVEFAKYGITVNMMTLGAVKIASKSGNPKWKPPVFWNPANQPKGGFLSGRVGLPEDVGWIVNFLADERSQYITGSALRADGGAMMV